MARKGYTQLQDTKDRQTWLRMVAKSMGMNADEHRDRVRIYDFALAAMAAQLTGAKVRNIPEVHTEETYEPTDPSPWQRELSHFEYLQSQKVYRHTAQAGFIATLAALMSMRDAGTNNMARLTREYPVISEMLITRDNADAGVIFEVDGYTAAEYIARQEAMDAQEADEADYLADKVTMEEQGE